MVSVPCSSYRTAVPIWFSSLVTGALPAPLAAPRRARGTRGRGAPGPGRAALGPTRARGRRRGCRHAAHRFSSRAPALPAAAPCSLGGRAAPPTPALPLWPPPMPAGRAAPPAHPSGGVATLGLGRVRAIAAACAASAPAPRWAALRRGGPGAPGQGRGLGAAAWLSWERATRGACISPQALDSDATPPVRSGDSGRHPFDVHGQPAAPPEDQSQAARQVVAG